MATILTIVYQFTTKHYKKTMKFANLPILLCHAVVNSKLDVSTGLSCKTMWLRWYLFFSVFSVSDTHFARHHKL